MKGGDLLATGSSSCIFRPSIPCKGSNKVNNGKISKIVYGSKSDKYFQKEKKMANLLKNIKGYERWCIVSDTFCKPPKYENIFKYDKTILDCKSNSSEFDETSKMMVSKYGGITFEDYFLSKIQSNMKQKQFEIVVYKLLVKMKQLFIGLKEIYHNKLIHLDIKYNNIVLDGTQFKYIDFGLSDELREIEHFKNRSLSEFNNNRLYLWYPAEYIYGNIDIVQQYNDLLKFNSGKYRKHFNEALNIHTFFDNSLNSHIKQLLTKDNYTTDKDYKELISMIDIYSLGIMIPFLFHDYDLIKHISDSFFLTALFDLFKKMCELNYKDRIKPSECLKEYKSLIKKYSYLVNKKKGKTKRRKKKLI